MVDSVLTFNALLAESIVMLRHSMVTSRLVSTRAGMQPSLGRHRGEETAPKAVVAMG